jgi:hypothetical protein
MSVSTGVNRLGKVIFWLSVVGVIVMHWLLDMGREKTGIRYELLVWCFFISVALIAGCVSEGYSKYPWTCCCVVLYTALFTAFMVNELPKADIQVTLVVLAVPPIAVGILIAVVIYVFQGLTPKA